MHNNYLFVTLSDNFMHFFNNVKFLTDCIIRCNLRFNSLYNISDVMPFYNHVQVIEPFPLVGKLELFMNDFQVFCALF